MNYPKFSHLRFRSVVSVLVAMATAQSQAAMVLFTDVMVMEGTVSQGSNVLDFDNPGSVSAPSSISASARGGITHDWGDRQTMEFAGAGTAQASYATVFPSLHSSASGTLTNTFYDPANIGTTEVPDGAIPPVYIVQARAGFSDTLLYGGTATGYNSRYVFRLSGSIAGSEAFVAVFMEHAQKSQDWIYFDVGNYDRIIVSNEFVGAPSLDFELRILAHFQPNTEYLLNGSDVMGNANFGSTLTFEGIDARDLDGNLLPAGSITTSDGSVVPIIEAPVPEPAGAVLGALSLVCLMFRRRRCD